MSKGQDGQDNDQQSNAGANNAQGTQPADNGQGQNQQGDDLSKVLENKNLWNLPRMQELVKAEREYKKLSKERATQEEKALEEQKKFQELAEKRKGEVEAKDKRIQDLMINQALTGKLLPLGVVDLDGALKLIDRSQIKIGENGEISGVDDVLKTFKEQKPYLFGQQQDKSLGSPSANSAAPSGVRKFTRAEIGKMTPDEYQKNRADIQKAQAAGLIE